MTVQLVNPGLIRRVREGEPSAIAELYERFGTMVYRTAFNIIVMDRDSTWFKASPC